MLGIPFSQGWGTILLIVLMSIMSVITGCGLAEPEHSEYDPVDTFRLEIDYVPDAVAILKSMTDTAIHDMQYYQDEYYPVFWRAVGTETWQQPDGLGWQYMPDYDFGVNTIASWYCGGLYLDACDGRSNAAMSFYDWGVSINWYVAGDPVQYNLKHNCFLDTSTVKYWEGNDLYIVTIPTLDWDHILERIPIL